MTEGKGELTTLVNLNCEARYQGEIREKANRYVTALLRNSKPFSLTSFHPNSHSSCPAYAVKRMLRKPCTHNATVTKSRLTSNLHLHPKLLNFIDCQAVWSIFQTNIKSKQTIKTTTTWCVCGGWGVGGSIA